MSISDSRINAPVPYTLWLVDLRAPIDSASNAALDAEERERAKRFVFEGDRRSYRAAHAALRRVLARATGQRAAALRFERGINGKPKLMAPSPLAFNMSHSAHRAAICWVDDPNANVGIDLEHYRPVPDLDCLARELLTPAEQSQLSAIEPPLRAQAFLRGWTRKEACLKALGAGLAIAPSSVETGLEAHARIVEVHHGKSSVRIEVCSHDLLGPWFLALARVLPPIDDRRPMKRGLCRSNVTTLSITTTECA